MKHAMCHALLLSAAIAASLGSAAAAQDACHFTTIGTAVVASVQDGRTLALADGRVLRLAGIEVGENSGEALQSLVGAQPLRLEALTTEHDRYDRIVAFAFMGGAKSSVQQLLLEQGHAMVSARVGDKGCAAILFAAERTARAARRGIWADPNFAPLSAEHSTGLTARRGRFALVEGKVLSVRESGATIYVNFGRRWTRDFTVTIARRQQRAFAAAGLAPNMLAGRRIRVRGWIEQRSGPIIAADAPEQIELLD